MAQHKIVHMNEEGLFLNVHEVSSHAPQKQYMYSWGLLNDSSTFNTVTELEKLSFKDDRPRTMLYAKAEEIRTVKLIGI